MSEALIFLDPNSDLNLQGQIRQKLVEAITLGTFPVGRRLPSSRKLADQLGVARNTVVLVYQQLTDEGYLISRERSGIYVNESIFEGRVGFEGKNKKALEITSKWRQRIKSLQLSSGEFICPPNWQQYPFPFIEGQFDASLYPVKEWREASRLALGVREINTWAGESGDADDPVLVEQIRTRILPRRGIQANADQILITVGTQQALYLIVQLLVDSATSVAVEEPGYPDLRTLLAQRDAQLVHQPVDREGMIVDENLDSCQLVFVTPSHQTPTGVTMSTERREQLLERASRRDMLIIEDDYESESNFLGHPHPALRGMDSENRVIYMSCISKVLSPGLRLGFMVAAPEVIAEARKLRKLMVRHPPLNNQRTVAFFLSLGHYDTFLMHLNKTFEQRWVALRRAVNYYLLHYVAIAPIEGGTAFWLRVPDEVNVKHVVKEAVKRGILLEPVGHYYASANTQDNCFRMSVTSIPSDKIREGVLRLRALFHELMENIVETFDTAKGEHLVGDKLKSSLQGTTMLCLLAYGDPCTIEWREDGSAIGLAGYANEDRDTGRWWVEGDKFYRQWSRWAWGEAAQYSVKRDGENIKLFDEQGCLIEHAIIRKSGDGSAVEYDSNAVMQVGLGPS